MVNRLALGETSIDAGPKRTAKVRILSCCLWGAGGSPRIGCGRCAEGINRGLYSGWCDLSIAAAWRVAIMLEIIVTQGHIT